MCQTDRCGPMSASCNVRPGDIAHTISTKATDHSTQNAATPRAVSTLPAKFHIFRPYASPAATLYTAADKRRTLAYKGADAEAVQKVSAFNPAEDRLCQPRLSQGARRFGAHHHAAAG